MSMTYDIVTVGGGLGGSALANAMAARGAKVLVLERETQFRDRVRGEYLSPWGHAEARRLGLESIFDGAGAKQAPWVIGFGPDRDLTATTPHLCGALAFYHPAMQEAMLAAAARSGADTRRGVNVKSVTPGAHPVVEFESGNGTESVAARLVVGADGRSSIVRHCGNFKIRRDVDRLTIGGVLLEGGRNFRGDAAYFMINPAIAKGSFAVPIGDGRFRAYVAHPTGEDLRLHGADSLARFCRNQHPMRHTGRLL